MHQKSKSDTSWQKVSNWYSDLVKKEGHYYHQKIIIPKLLKLLDLNSDSSVLDLGCGQGILERYIPANIYYQGIDAATDLVRFAQKNCLSTHHHFQAADVTRPLPISKFDFTHALLILALQNMEKPGLVLENINKHLVTKGKLLIVINHPCFRIPKNSAWEIDKKNNIQYRRIDRYLSNLKIPILINPGLKENSPQMTSFHYPLSTYTQMLAQTGFMISTIEEWVSDKTSVGKNAEMENIARKEFPLFMAILAKKV